MGSGDTGAGPRTGVVAMYTYMAIGWEKLSVVKAPVLGMEILILFVLL